MARGILKGGAKLLGIGKKKPAEAAVAPAEQKGPIITLLSGATAPNAAVTPRRQRPNAQRNLLRDTILSDKLGA